MPIEVQCHRCHKTSTLSVTTDIVKFKCDCGATTFLSVADELQRQVTKKAEAAPSEPGPAARSHEIVLEDADAPAQKKSSAPSLNGGAVPIQQKPPEIAKPVVVAQIAQPAPMSWKLAEDTAPAQPTPNPIPAAEPEVIIRPQERGFNAFINDKENRPVVWGAAAMIVLVIGIVTLFILMRPHAPDSTPISTRESSLPSPPIEKPVVPSNIAPAIARLEKTPEVPANFSPPDDAAARITAAFEAVAKSAAAARKDADAKIERKREIKAEISRIQQAYFKARSHELDTEFELTKVEQAKPPQSEALARLQQSIEADKKTVTELQQKMKALQDEWAALNAFNKKGGEPPDALNLLVNKSNSASAAELRRLLSGDYERYKKTEQTRERAVSEYERSRLQVQAAQDRLASAGDSISRARIGKEIDDAYAAMKQATAQVDEIDATLNELKFAMMAKAEKWVKDNGSTPDSKDALFLVLTGEYKLQFGN